MGRETWKKKFYALKDKKIFNTHGCFQMKFGKKKSKRRFSGCFVFGENNLFVIFIKENSSEL